MLHLDPLVKMMLPRREGGPARALDEPVGGLDKVGKITGSPGVV